MEEEKKDEVIIEERKKRLKEFFLGKNLLVIAVLIIALIFGIYIRSQPMTDHGGHPGLWDITTNTWTLGPDLDPFLFLRYSEIIAKQGNLAAIDTMRNVPLGFDTSIETKVLPYLISYTYKLLNTFSEASIEYAAVIFPVIMFALTILVFFLFVREVFARKDEDKTKANIIALISTFFMIVVPIFLSRTVAGIPEKESAAFFFMFLAFYLFLRAWKSEKLISGIILGILSGSATALMGLVWGGVSYIFVSIAVASFMAFILNRFHKKEFIIYFLWLLFSFIVIALFTKKFSLMGLITSLDTGIAFLIFIILAVHFILWKTKLSEIKFLKEAKIPKNITSLIISIILIAAVVTVFWGPGFIIDKVNMINQIMFKPVIGRWSQTVAENRQPYFTEWGASFGPFIKGIPIMFWLFFIGSVVLFRNMLNKIRKKDAWILTAFYILFFFGLVFSRYAPQHLFNGENFSSKAFYYGSALLLAGMFIYYYVVYHKENNNSLEKIDFEFLFLFSLFVLCLFTARSAVRLIMVLGPIAPIFFSYLLVESISSFRKSKEETLKVIFGVAVIILIVLGLFVFYGYYSQVKAEAYSYVPYAYTYQWQKAMAWTRMNTTSDAVFAHWWDYGYWVQSIGKRATVTDGGNAIVWWNYLTGRLVLTTDNEKDALGFLYNHNATHLLIDPTDLGKYGAFSSIGSNKDYDRYSPGPTTFLSDEKSIKETKDSIIRDYNLPVGNGQIAISSLEEDIVYNENSSKTILMKEKTGLIGLNIEILQKNGSISFKKAEAAFTTSDRQMLTLPVRYLYYNGTFIDFGKGIEATAYIIPRIYQDRIDNLGAAMYISPRLMRGLLAQIYILNDPLKNFQHFKLVHSEPDLNIDSINKQGYSVNEFAYFEGRGTQGPIKIWKIEYAGDEKINPDYLRTSPPASIDWQF